MLPRFVVESVKPPVLQWSVPCPIRLEKHLKSDARGRGHSGKNLPACALDHCHAGQHQPWSDRDEALFAQQQVVRLQALLEASRLIHSTIVLDDVLNTVLRIVVRELELDGAFFRHFLNSYGDVPQTFSVPDRDAAGHRWWSVPATQPCGRAFRCTTRRGATFTELIVIRPAGSNVDAG